MNKNDLQIFKSLFKGREDVFAIRWEKGEKSGYICLLINWIFQSTTPKYFNEIIRGHWGIENKLHRCLDVMFKEDYSTKQAGNAAENFSFITKIALNLLKNENSRKRSLKNKRLLCGWDETFLANLLFKQI